MALELKVLLRRLLATLMVAVVLSACNLRRPEVTLTLAPIDTRTPEATEVQPRSTRTRVVRQTPTEPPTVTVTPLPSATETDFPTDTATPTTTATHTATESETPTTTPSDTASATDAPTATDTDQPTETDTLEPTETDTLEPTETDTLVPTGTYTAIATDTAVPTATQTATATNTDTAVPTETRTATATEEPTLTATYTVIPTDTAIATVQPSPTRILLNTATPTATATDEETESPSLPQQVDESAPTASPQTTNPNNLRFLPTLTPLPTLDQTQIAELLATPRPRPTLPPTWTAVPTLPPAETLAPPTALATAPIDASTPNVQNIFITTPIPSTPQAQFGGATFTPSPTATLFQPTVAVRTDLLLPVIPPPVSEPTTFSTVGASAYQYNVGLGQLFTFGDLTLPGGVSLFLPNPVDAGSFLRTDYRGQLLYKPIGVQQEGHMSYSPYFDGFSVPSIELNKNRIAELDWSADGQQFSFRIDTPSGLDNGNAGVWFWQPYNDPQAGPTFQIIRDCVAPGYTPCNFVYPNGAKHWKTIDVQWSPIRGSNSILLTLYLPQERRNALAIANAVRDPKYANNAPPLVRYDYGYWNPSGQGITVSGRRPDGRVTISEVNNDLSGERLILDGSARRLWLRDAVQLPGGGYAALGRPGGPGSGPVALYDGNGIQISQFIGNEAPDDVRWYPDRSIAVVSVQGRQYSVQVDGGAVTDTTNLTNNPQFSESGLGAAQIPSAVVQGTEYWPGQQLRTIVPYLNVRAEPTTSSQIISGLVAGDYVAIVAGPYENEGYRWWRVQTASNAIGWIAATIGGYPTIRPQ